MPTVSLDSLLWGTACVLSWDILFLSLVTLQEIHVSRCQRNSTVASEQALVTSVSLALVMMEAFGDQHIYLGPGFGSSDCCDCGLDRQGAEVLCSLYA